MSKQPKRKPSDGPVGVKRCGEDGIAITATRYGVEGILIMSEYNAWRVFGLLALMLGVRLPKKVSETIKLGERLDAKVGPPKDATFGDRLAFALAMQLAGKAKEPRK